MSQTKKENIDLDLDKVKQSVNSLNFPVIDTKITNLSKELLSPYTTTVIENALKTLRNSNIQTTSKLTEPIKQSVATIQKIQEPVFNFSRVLNSLATTPTTVSLPPPGRLQNESILKYIKETSTLNKEAQEKADKQFNQVVALQIQSNNYQYDQLVLTKITIFFTILAIIISILAATQASLSLYFLSVGIYILLLGVYFFWIKIKEV